MKKFLISMCVALVGLCASAQEKGDMAAGLNLCVAPCLEKGVSLTNFGIGAKLQYNVTNPIRLEANFDYGFQNKATSVFDLSANVHYLFNITNKLKAYPLVGIGFAQINGGVEFDYSNGGNEDNPYDGWWKSPYPSYEIPTEDSEVQSESTGSTKFLLNVGVGAEYSLTDRLSVGAEIKYQYIQHFSRLPINIGLTYKF